MWHYRKLIKLLWQSRTLVCFQSYCGRTIFVQKTLFLVPFLFHSFAVTIIMCHLLNNIIPSPMIDYSPQTLASSLIRSICYCRLFGKFFKKKLAFNCLTWGIQAAGVWRGSYCFSTFYYTCLLDWSFSWLRMYSCSFVHSI